MPNPQGGTGRSLHQHTGCDSGQGVARTAAVVGAAGRVVESGKQAGGAVFELL